MRESKCWKSYEKIPNELKVMKVLKLCKLANKLRPQVKTIYDIISGD